MHKSANYDSLNVFTENYYVYYPKTLVAPPPPLCDNYRPISVISIVPKVFEKVVHEQLMKYLEHHQIISKFQSGFRANHSTETSLLHVTNSWLANMDAGLINGVLFLDLKKAFDTVNHKILLSKLGCYGIRGLALSWFQSYLSNRKQICKVNNSLSTFQNITCGIPQGSKGPVIIYGRGGRGIFSFLKF